MVGEPAVELDHQLHTWPDGLAHRGDQLDRGVALLGGQFLPGRPERVELEGPVAKGDRLPGSLAAALLGAAQGVQLLRVHDVAATRQALAVWEGSLS